MNITISNNMHMTNPDMIEIRMQRERERERERGGGGGTCHIIYGWNDVCPVYMRNCL